jgi:hypothetical protein
MTPMSRERTIVTRMQISVSAICCCDITQTVTLSAVYIYVLYHAANEMCDG